MIDETMPEQQRYAVRLVRRMMQLIPLVDGSVPRYAGLRDELDTMFQYVRDDPAHTVNWDHYLDTLRQRLTEQRDREVGTK